MAGYLVFAVATLLVLGLVAVPLLRQRRRRALVATAFPAHWHRLLSTRWRLYTELPVPVRQALQRQLQLMMAETSFYGCNGLQVSEQMQVLILAQASLMSAGRGQMQWAGFPVVLLYPDAFVREGAVTDELGLVAYERHELLGESWEQGKVVLSWADIDTDLRQNAADGHCLVIHEYAHQLDGRDGVMDGTPPMLEQARLQRWALVMGEAYEDLCQRLQMQQTPPIDPYAATNPEEFFAVVSEHFFTRPDRLVEAYPSVYQELADFYCLEPLHWYGAVRAEP